MESDINDDKSTMAQRQVLRRSVFQQFGGETAKFAFEQVLKASRVYNKPGNRHSLSSATSTALYTTALFVFSNLTLSQVSNIAFFALPIYAVDLSASECYVFGEEGAEYAIGRDRDYTSDLTSASTIRAETNKKTVTYKVENLHILREGLALYVRKPDQLLKLDDLIFLSCFGYNIETDHFTVGAVHTGGPLLAKSVCSGSAPRMGTVRPRACQEATGSSTLSSDFSSSGEDGKLHKRCTLCTTPQDYVSVRSG